MKSIIDQIADSLHCKMRPEYYPAKCEDIQYDFTNIRLFIHNIIKHETKLLINNLKEEQL